jgi:hypothetical protein
MGSHPRRCRFYIESCLGELTGFLALLTATRADWIEGVFGFDPDHHSGSVEVLIVVVFAVVSISLAVAACLEYRRLLSNTWS